MTTLGLQGDELLAQLRELLYLPSSPTTSSGDGRWRRRKRCRNDNENNNGDEEPHPRRCGSGKTSNRKTKQQKSSKYLVTSVPDFDGYQWRKYGQKQIEGAMYARSYYRCTRSAEQGCPAKRTVQRNDDDGNPAKYTVVYMGEHTCTANDSLEAPVILETTAVVVPASATSSSANKQQQRRPQHDDDTAAINNSSMAGSCCSSTTTTAATGIIESPATSDITWSSSDHVVDYSGLFPIYDSWAPASLQEMEDFTGPIRSPVHVPTDGWTIDQFLLHAAI
ncbi:unnamed protein product [Urochloa decumbens]|uniref:WRKY domain-containing protein n=1 Tax=Urochloa decumbens TaxID=240449 RepID=A0ABC9HFN9_9POAL